MTSRQSQTPPLLRHHFFSTVLPLYNILRHHRPDPSPLRRIVRRRNCRLFHFNMIESVDATCEVQVGEPLDGDSMPGLQDMDDLSSGGDRSDRQCYLGAETLVANLPNKF